MTTPPDWVTSVPSTPSIHDEAAAYQWQGLSQQELESLRANLIESVVRAVVEAIQGFFTVGVSALAQLAALLENVPVIGPLISAFINYLSSGSQTSGTLDDLIGLLENIPLVGQLVSLFEPLIDPLLIPFSGLFDFLAGIVSGLLSIFSFGLINLGGGGFSIGGAGGLGFGLGDTLGNTGLITTDNPLPSHQLSTIAPGKSDNKQPDPEFDMGLTSVNGQGRWVVDIIGGEGGDYGENFCVRTARHNLITVYILEGTMEMEPGVSAGFGWADVRAYWEGFEYTKTTGGTGYDVHICDTTKFELIRVPYAASLFPLSGSVQEGTAHLVNMIKAIPGPFILIGHSLGTIVISNVLDELRTGSLQNRYSDLLFGFQESNIRREKGSGFPDLYRPGQYVVYDTQGFGVYMPVLTGTLVAGLREKWWEVALPAGTYPMDDDMHGLVVSEGDPFCTLPDNQLGRDVRAAVTEIKNEPHFTMSSMADANDALMAGIGGSTGHGTGTSTIQPFLGDGDHRDMDTIVWDKIRAFGDEFTPPEHQEESELEGVHVPVQDGQIITASAAVCWMGVVCPTEAIAVRINVFNAQHQYLETLWSDGSTLVGISQQSHEWMRLEGEFLVANDEAEYVCLSLWTSEDVNKTGIVWFAQCTLETDAVLDAALLGNMANAAHTFIDRVGGAQGQGDLDQSLKTLIDGLASAASQSTHEDVTYAEMFDIFQDMTMTTFASMDLGQQHDERLQAIEAELAILGPGTYHPPETVNWPTAGQTTWSIPLYARGVGTIFDCVLLGGGGSAGTNNSWQSGQGGANAHFTKTTLVMGTHIPIGATELVIKVGVGGAAVTGANQDGLNGTDSYIALTNGTILATSAGGQHGGKGAAPNPLNDNWGGDGLGPGNTDFYGQTFFGGTDVSSWYGALTGSPPGGGGSAPGGAGAVGKVWIALGRTP